MKIILRLLTLAFSLATALPAVADQFSSNLLLPPMGVYISSIVTVDGDFDVDGRITFPSGAVLSHLTLELPSKSEAPPVSGTKTQQFEVTARMKLSLGAGSPTRQVSALATVSFILTFSEALDPEIQLLDIRGGDLPAGVMIRESPTLASTGQTRVVQADGSYSGDVSFQISSFFDIFTEISLDGGATWSPADGAMHMVLTAPSGERALPTGFLPVPADYDGDGISAFGQGVVFGNLRLGKWAQSFAPPAAGAMQTNQTTATFAGKLSFDDGKTFSQFSAPATFTQKVKSYLDSGNTRFFDTEMLQLDIAGGSLPSSVMLRESPTKASTGRTSIRLDAASDTGASFFDVFLEVVSLDGGANWLPTLNGACVFALPKTVPTPLVSVGDPVPGAGVAGSGVPAGAVFKRVGPPALNGRGDIAFRGEWTSPTGPGVCIVILYAGTGVADRVVARVDGTAGGGPLGGGKMIKELKDPGIDDGYVTFLGSLAGSDQPAKHAAIVQFRLADGSTRIAAETGAAVADVPGALLKSITSWAPLGGGQVLFGGTLTGGGIGGKNDRALFSTDSAGALHVLIQKGVTPNVVFIGEVIGEVSQTLIVKDFEVLRPMPGANGMTRAFNRNGEVVLKVSYSDRELTTGIVHINVP